MVSFNIYLTMNRTNFIHDQFQNDSFGTKMIGV